ncbi:hypothetical protein KCU88_g446, partial [Aureobasidium melanogenum]
LKFFSLFTSLVEESGSGSAEAQIGAPTLRAKRLGTSCLCWINSNVSTLAPNPGRQLAEDGWRPQRLPPRRDANHQQTSLRSLPPNCSQS